MSRLDSVGSADDTGTGRVGSADQTVSGVVGSADDGIVIRGEINALDDRAAMGLPSSYVSPQLESVDAEVGELRGADVDELAKLVESSEEPLARRFAAGVVLALVGDPRCPDVDPVMVDVPAGVATIGIEPDRVDALYERYRRFGVKRNWLEKECPRFQVPVDGFRIGRYPVANGQYLAFLRETGDDRIPTSWPFGRMPLDAANAPVYTVTAEAADAYAAWLAARTGRRFRLPTETEWEYVAAGPEGREFPWGDTFVVDAANTMEQKLLTTTPVGMFPRGATDLGVLDLAGNVEEYVAGRYYPYPGWEVVEDDLFKELGYYRVARGGAFNRFQDLARCQRRHGPYPRSLYAIGFRLAEDVTDRAASERGL